MRVGQQLPTGMRRSLVVGLAFAFGALGPFGCDASGTAGRSMQDTAAAGVAEENTPDAAVGAGSEGDLKQRARRVVILGTSLTAGLGLASEEAYPALLQQKADSAGLDVRIVNAGLSGETSAGALRRAAWVLDQPAFLVVLEVGANDGLRGMDPDSTYANLVSLVHEIRTAQPDALVVLVQMEAPTNLGASYTGRFHAAYVRAAKDTGVPLWPFLLEGVAGITSLNQADGIHPNVTGSKRVAETVWRSLKSVLTGRE